MSTEVDPIPGNWYQHLDKGQEFQVIDVDETGGVVETQHFDGDIEEITLDDWYELDLEHIEPPEDWTGPVDEIEADDLGYSDTSMAPEDWSEPLSEIKPSAGEEEGGEETGPETEAQSALYPGVRIEPYRE